MNARMKAIVEYVRLEHPVYDLCCDHGLLGMAALQSKQSGAVVFVDQSPRALSRLRRSIQQQGLEHEGRVSVIRARAEDLALPQQASDFILAGVGIQTMIRILDKLFPNGLEQHRLILAPQQKSQDLRFYLRQRGFGLFDEQVVLEKGRFREIIVIEAEGEPVTLYGQRYMERQDAISQAYLLYLHHYYAQIQQKQAAGIKKDSSASDSEKSADSSDAQCHQ